MTFGEKLQKLRSREGLSQDALAELLDVSRQAVSKWERNEAMPEAEKIVRISRQFGVTTDYLLMEEREDPGTPADPQLWDRLKTLYRESGYLLGWIPAAWGTWGLLKSVWNSLITLPVLGGWGVLQLFFAGLLTAHVQNLLKILFGALLVLYGRRAAGRLRWSSLAWSLVVLGAFGVPRISAVRTGLVPFFLTILQAGPLMTDGSEWGELFTGLLRESGGCFFLLALGFAILLLGRRLDRPAPGRIRESAENQERS